MVEVKVSVPALPAVPDRSDRMGRPVELVPIEAVTPILAELIESDRSESVPPPEGRLTVCMAPPPTWMLTAPVRTSLALATGVSPPVELALLVPATLVKLRSVPLVAAILDFVVNAP